MEATKRALTEEFCGLVLTYRVNDTLLCVPVEHVDSVIEPPELTEIPHAPDYVLGAFMHRGKTALALSLRRLLRLPAGDNKHKKESLVVIWMGDQAVGYWVDEIKGMTDSGRGHWSAVPALIRDQGITRALVCDGNVFFPLDLTQSRQFNEIHRTLESFEKNRVHQVTTPAPLEPDSGSLEPEPVIDAPLPAGPVEHEALPAEEEDYTVADLAIDDGLEESYEEHIQTTAFAEHEMDIEALAGDIREAGLDKAEVISIHPLPDIGFDANGQGDAFLDMFAGLSTVESMPVEDVVDEAVSPFIDENQLDAFDTAYLELLRQEALQKTQVSFDAHGQGDAFLESLTEMEATQRLDENEFVEEVIQPEADRSQLDAFDESYLELLRQEALPAPANDTPVEVDDDLETVEGLAITEGPYSLLPSRLPEDEADEPALLQAAEALTEPPFEAETPGFDESVYALQRQAEIEALFETAEDELPDADVDAAGDLDGELLLTEEPYSLLPSRLPEDEADEPALLQAPEALTEPPVEAETPGFDESVYALQRQAEIEALFETAEDELPDADVDAAGDLDGDLLLTEEPYSLLPTRLPEDEMPSDGLEPDPANTASGEAAEIAYARLRALDFDDADIEGDGSEPPTAEGRVKAQPASEEAPVLALLPHLQAEPPLADSVDRPATEDGQAAQAAESAVGLSRHTDLPDMQQTFARADFYAGKLVEGLPPGTDDAGGPAVADTESLLPDTASELRTEPGRKADYDLKPPVLPSVPETGSPLPADSNRSHQLLPDGAIIRPDGQLQRSYGLVKLFTIILATSAAGTWWYRDELFYREQLRKEMPSILQNEIAYLYAERVRIINPHRGRERMIVDTPDEEIRVIRRRYVSRDLLRERRKKGIKIHRVRKGDTLWAIAERYLDDAYRYPELAENHRIHNPDMIRPGDVVKITFKKAAKK